MTAATLNHQTAMQETIPEMPSQSGSNLPADQLPAGTQRSVVGGDSNSQQPTIVSVPNTATAAASNVEQQQPRNRPVTQPAPGMLLFDPLLSILAEGIDDTERVKNAQTNRLRTLTRNETDSDGEARGAGLTLDHPVVATLAQHVDQLVALDAAMTKALSKQLRKHALYPWIKAQRGIGDKQAARLLHAIGDPYWNTLHNRPRTVSELWAYCGLHVLPASQRRLDTQAFTASGATTAGGDISQRCDADTQVSLAGIAPRRSKGQQANWSTEAKTRAWLIIESSMKQLDSGCKTDTGIADHMGGCKCGPYRIVVDKRRTHTSTTHPEWTPKHSQLDGMRIASKEMLKDLWLASKTIYDAAETGDPS